MENKQYEIKTISDFADVVTEENLERLFVDFLNVMTAVVRLKKESVPFELTGFVWIDDGKEELLPPEITIK